MEAAFFISKPKVVVVPMLKDLEAASSIAKLIWARRNDFVHGKDLKHPSSIIQRSQTELSCFRVVKAKAPQSLASPASSPQTWKKPPEGKYKMNWDASLNTTEGLVGVGAIIRDSYGRVMGTLRARRKVTLSPFAAEAYALMMAVLFCKEAGINEIILEGDSLQVVKKLSDQEEDRSIGGRMIEDTACILRSFVAWSVSHTKRDANEAAHVLAKNALLSEFDHYDLEDIPCCIKRVVASDACNL